LKGNGSSGERRGRTQTVRFFDEFKLFEFKNSCSDCDANLEVRAI
jgi:hypothetical protein